jgi:luciferase family oxidoreductase group 1
VNAARPMSSPLRLSVLDQSPIASGSSGADALANTIDLACLAEALGYHRYWVAEHHGAPMLAGPSPEALIGPIATLTSGLRVGSGGVMLPHYSPLKVAESFSLLSGLFPGRIDLALGRAAGTDPLTTLALQRDRRQAAPDDFRDQLDELLAYIENRMPAQHPFARLAATLPGLPHAPEPWLLGSSEQSARWAAELGLPYAFADFINPRGAPIAARYRTAFSGSHRRSSPYQAVGVSVLCADSADEAEFLASSVRMAMTLLRRGELIAVPAPETAVHFLAQQGRDSLVPGARRRMVLGDPPSVRRELERIAGEYGAQELIVVTITHDHAMRRRSYELLAGAFDLVPRSAVELVLASNA